MRASPASSTALMLNRASSRRAPRVETSTTVTVDGTSARRRGLRGDPVHPQVELGKLLALAKVGRQPDRCRNYRCAATADTACLMRSATAAGCDT
jgi:hypothetical protein